MKSDIVYCITILTAAILMVGCSTFAKQGTATEDAAYLTQIPRETLQAYQFGSPIEDKMEAVIIAWLSLDTTRLSYTETPKVISAEAVRFEDARSWVAQPGIFHMIGNTEDIPGDTKVWLVLFEGDWQISGPPADPEHPITPEPGLHGCVYVIIVDPNYLERTQIGTTRCSL